MSDNHSNISSRRPHNTLNDPYSTYDPRRSLRHISRHPGPHNHSSRGGSFTRQGQYASQSSLHRRTRSYSANSANRRAMTIHLAQRSNQNSLRSLQQPIKSPSDAGDSYTSSNSKVTFAASPKYKSESKNTNSIVSSLGKLSLTSFVKNTILSITKSSPLIKRRNSFSGSSDTDNQDKVDQQTPINTFKPNTFKLPSIQNFKNKTNVKTISIPGVVGITNHGNSCFINAVVQCLSNVEPFLEFFLENSRHFEKPLTKSFANLVESLWLRKYNAKLSQKFRSVVASTFNQFVDDSQNDAQEFLLLLLDRIQQELLTNKNIKNKNIDLDRANLVKKLFETKLTSCLTCLKCRHTSYTVDNQLTICLPIQDPQTVRIIHVPTTDQEKQRLYALVVNSSQNLKHLLEMAGNKFKVHPKDIAFVHIDKRGRYKEYTRLDGAVATIMPFDYLFFVQLVNRRKPQTNSSSSTTSPNHNNSNNSSPSKSRSSINPEFINVVALPMLRTDTGLQRFGSLISLDTMRTCSYFELQMLILTRLKPYFTPSFFIMKNVRSTFRMRVYIPGEDKIKNKSRGSNDDDDEDGGGDDDDDDYEEDLYLHSSDEMPLFSLVVERALSFFDRGTYGAPYLRIILEFQYVVREHLMRLNQEKFFAKDRSYHELELDNNSCDLMTCLDAFTQQEQLGADDTWVCSTCRSRKAGSLKTLMFTGLSEVLVVLLKRFKQDGDERLKIETRVEFPVNGLDLSRLVTYDSTSLLSLIQSSPGIDATRLNRTWDNASLNRDLNSENLANEDLVYDLVAVCNHHGDLHNGHYTAFCKNPLNKTWYHFNDHKTEELPVDRIVTNSAYMLFYWRRGHKSQPRFDLNNWLNAQATTNGVSSTDSSQSLLSFNGIGGQTPCSLSLDSLSTNQVVSKASPQPLKSILKPSQSMSFNNNGSNNSNSLRHKSCHVRICDTADHNGNLVSKPPTSHSNVPKPTKAEPSVVNHHSIDLKPVQRPPPSKSAPSNVKTMVLCPPPGDVQAVNRQKRKTDELVRRMRSQAFEASASSTDKKSASLIFEKVNSGSESDVKAAVLNDRRQKSGNKVGNGKIVSKMESTV